MTKTVIHRRPRLIAGAVVVAAAAAMFATGTAGATTEPPPPTTPTVDSLAIDDDIESVVEVTSTGDSANQVLIAAAPAAGDRADVATEIHSDVHITATGDPISAPQSDPAATQQTADQGLVVDSNFERSLEVDSASPDGSFVAVVTLDAFDQTIDQTGVADDDPGFGALPDMTPLIDVPTEQQFRSDGTIESAQAAEGTSLTTEQEEALDGFVDESFRYPAMVPDVAVGEGATWTVSAPSEGFDPAVPMPLNLELVSLSGDEFTIEMSFEVDLSELVDAGGEGGGLLGGLFGGVTGTATGSAEYTGSVSNFLDRTSHLTIEMDIHIGTPENDYSGSLTGTYELTETSTPA